MTTSTTPAPTHAASTMPLLTAALHDAVIVQRGTYTYLVSPLESIRRPLDPALLTEISAASIRLGAMEGIDLIVCFETMSTHLGAVLSVMTGVPFSIARKKHHAVAQVHAFAVTNNYQETTFHLYGSFTGAKVLLIDDIVTTGNTLRGAALALQALGAAQVRALVVVGRGAQYATTLDAVGVPYTILSRVNVRDGQIEIVAVA